MIKKLILFLAFVGSAFSATTTNWVCPEWTGTQSGTAVAPYRALDSTRLALINTALSSGNVYVYTCGRYAASDTEHYHSASGSTSVADNLDLSVLTYSGANTLTIDGTTIYNTSAGSPSWSANTGTNRARFAAIITQNGSVTKHSNIIFYGLKGAPATTSKAISLCGDNLLVDNCEFTHITGGGGSGPCVLIVPTSDGAHQGSGSFAPVCTNIVIQNCVVHDTCGEAIYVGGGGDTPGASGSGYPSHNGITIQGCTIYNAGAIAGGQGDGIDIKGGLQSLIIRSNIIYNIGIGAGNPARAIVSQGMYQIGNDPERLIVYNKIFSCTNIEDGAIALVNSWGIPTNTLVAGNLIYDISRNGAGVVGVRVYQSNGEIRLINNTIANVEGYGIALDTGTTALIKNNILASNNSGGAQVTYNSATINGSDYNIRVGSSMGYGSEGAHSSSSSTAALFVSYAGRDLHLLSTSPARGAGVAVSGVTADFDGVAFASPPSIGAFEYASGGGGGGGGTTATGSTTGGTRGGGVVFR